MHVFESHRIAWNIMGRDDPWWSVWTRSDFKGTDLPASAKREFYESGVALVDSTLRSLNVSGGRVLDLGCGLGRLSLALASHFEEVVCLDQSYYHLKTAKKETFLYDRERASRLTFKLSSPRMLDVLDEGSFDFIISFITLQHMVTELQVIYIEHLCDVLKKDGKGYFQIPAHIPNQPRDVHCDHLDTDFSKTFPGGMEMHYTPLTAIRHHLRKRGCMILSHSENDHIGIYGSSSPGIFFKKTLTVT